MIELSIKPIWAILILSFILSSLSVSVFADTEEPPMPSPPFFDVASEHAPPKEDNQNDTSPPPTEQHVTNEVETPVVEKPKPQIRPKVLDVKPLIKQPDKQTLKSGVIIKSRPGITETVEIAKGKLNRIITAYANPKVLTVDNVETKIDGAAVYVATDMETPVSLFISDVETGQATSLQLIPISRSVPVEIRIESDAQPNPNVTSAVGSEIDKPFRQESDYLSDIKGIMQALAKQLIPPGFTLDESAGNYGALNVCHSPYLKFSHGQTLSSQDMHIAVLIAENTGMVPVMFEEAFCASEFVMAVSAWPKVLLNHGEKTEVFVLIKTDQEQDEEHRPSLL